jgi:hypothetical protein
MWIKIDDGSNESAKLDGLSDAAYRCWAMALIESRKKKNLWREGVIPRGELASITRGKWKPKRLAELVLEILEAKEGGKSGMGLWEPLEDGWKIHDWHQYGPDETKPKTLSPSELGQRGGKASAQSRRAKKGTAIPERAPNRPKSHTEPLRSVLSEALPEPLRVLGTEANTEAAEAPAPVPDPNKSPKPSQPVRLVPARPEGSDGFRAPGRITAEELDAALDALSKQREAKCQ